MFSENITQMLPWQPPRYVSETHPNDGIENSHLLQRDWSQHVTLWFQLHMPYSEPHANDNNACLVCFGVIMSLSDIYAEFYSENVLFLHLTTATKKRDKLIIQIKCCLYHYQYMHVRHILMFFSVVFVSCLLMYFCCCCFAVVFLLLRCQGSGSTGFAWAGQNDNSPLINLLLQISHVILIYLQKSQVHKIQFFLQFLSIS